MYSRKEKEREARNLGFPFYVVRRLELLCLIKGLVIVAHFAIEAGQVELDGNMRDAEFFG